MKQVIQKRFVLAALSLLAVSPGLFAQKEKNKDKKKEETHQTIVITRNSDVDEKIVVEVDGDKIKVNGKDVKDLKDINVTIQNSKGTSFYRVGPSNHTWTFSDQFSLFDEDENRAMLGVNTDDREKGVEVLSITADSAAEKAGLKKGDIIQAIDDKKIETTHDLTEAIRSHKPGDKVTVTYERGGKKEKVTAELGKWKGMRMNAVTVPSLDGIMKEWKHLDPAELPRAFQGGGQNIFMYSGKPRLGISIQDTDEGKGVKILEVDEESNAAKAGLKKDDIIMSIDDKEISSTDDVMKVIRADKNKYNYKFKVQRGAKMIDVEVKFPKKLKQADL